MSISVVSKKQKSGKQQVQGVVVAMKGKELVFNYNTTRDPESDEIELLRLFRNRFVDELEQLNTVLARDTKE